MKRNRQKIAKDVGCLPIPLTAGHLTMEFVQGRLRDFYYGDTCVLKEIYFALRDRNWNTIPFVITGGFTEIQENCFRIEFQAEHHQDGILFNWSGCIEGGEDSAVKYTFHGTAGSDFERNRLGFCILHPDSCAGQRCAVTHGNGVREEGVFPKLIAPHQPFFAIRAITSCPEEGTFLDVEFDGDIFEMEDQRNWTDASFKTYCTPLERPFPVTVRRGEALTQAVTVSLRRTDEKEKREIEKEPQGKGGEHIISYPALYSDILPSLGCCIEQVPSERQRSLAEAMGLSHLRYDYFFEPDGAAGERVEEIARWLATTGMKLVLAAHFPDDAQKRVEEIRSLIRRIRGVADSVIVYGVGNTLPDRDLAALLKKGEEFAGIRVGSGTDAFFTQLNRERPDVSAWDFVAYSNNPQVHAFDDKSIMETIRGQRWNIQSCRAICRKPIYVTPLTLKMRWNPDATKPQMGRFAYEEVADARQTSDFLAVWTLKSICMMAQEKAALATYFTLAGPRGVMGEDEIYPVWKTLAFAGHFRQCRLSARWDDETAALYAEKDGRHYALVGNGTPHPQNLFLSGGGKIYEGSEGEEGWLTINPGSEFILPAYSMLCIDFSE